MKIIYRNKCEDVSKNEMFPEIQPKHKLEIDATAEEIAILKEKAPDAYEALVRLMNFIVQLMQ